jgi:hypothetical protein
MRRWRGAAVTAAVVALVVQPGTASAGGDGHGDGTVTPVTDEGLQGPRQLSHYGDDSVVVAESDSGQISSVDLESGAVHTLATFGTPEAPASPQGVDYADGHLYVALGETGGGPEAGPPPPVQLPPDGTPVPRCTETSTAPTATALVKADPDGKIDAVCDLLQYELVVNPDRQTQVDANSVPVDSLSNPYAVLVQHERVLVADAGANAVLAIDRDSGEISTFFVPPLVTDGACAGAENNPASDKYPVTVGCDPVPTGVTTGPDGRIYVSTLGALTPGAGRVYVLDSDGKEVRRITGLNPMTGIVVDCEGAVYVSELTGDVPIDQTDPATPVGRVVRIDGDDRSYAAVTLPQGLAIDNGRLYASALSLVPDGGQVVQVPSGAFTAGSTAD